MRTKMSLFANVLFAVIFLATIVTAQSQNQQTYWHTSDYYSIQLDGAGNAFVSEQVNLQSISRTPVNSITLQIPYTGVTVYQIISENSYPYYGGCLDCAYPAVYPQYNNNPQFVNYTTTKTSDSTLLTMHLNQPLVNSSQATLYIFFSTSGVAQKTFQGYQFSFKTVIDNNALARDSYASVEIPQNMYLKGEPSFNVNYTPAMSALASATSATGVAAALPAIFRYGYQYHSSNLLPGEFFSVTGLYGSSLILLYVQEIVIGIIALVLIVLLFKYILWARIKKLFARKEKSSEKSNAFSYGRTIIAGFVSGFLFQVAYFTVQVVYTLVGNLYYYNSPLPILFLLLSLIVYAMALFSLPYYLYTRYSRREGIVAGILSIIFGIIFFVIILFLFLQPVIYNPVPLTA